MEFRTQIPISKSNHLIDYNSKIVSLGSCFAVNMAEKFDHFKFQNSVNPFGILFHPKAIEKCIGFAVNRKKFTETDIFFHNERWHCYDMHSDLSLPDKNEMLQQLNRVVFTANEQISKATHAIITFGTAWVYTNVDSVEIVANCHKVPQKQFSKTLMSVGEVATSIRNIIILLREANPNTQIIFTISPVRHIKDGFVENQWSKSNLISGLQEVIAQNSGTNNLNSSYFPSYEIMMDELRDYRFYAEDMIHPSQIAVDYIWQRFLETQIDEASLPMMKEIEEVQKSLAHKPFNQHSQQHSDFLQTLQKRISILKSQGINF